MSSNTSDGTLRQERDDPPRGKVYIGAAVLAFLLVSGGAVTWMAEPSPPWRAGERREAAPVTVAPREVELIDQTLFSAHVPSQGNWAAKRRALASYSWVDQERGLVRIPIERAMALVVEGDHVE